MPADGHDRCPVCQASLLPEDHRCERCLRRFVRVGDHRFGLLGVGALLGAGLSLPGLVGLLLTPRLDVSPALIVSTCLGGLALGMGAVAADGVLALRSGYDAEQGRVVTGAQARRQGWGKVFVGALGAAIGGGASLVITLHRYGVL